MYWYINNLMNHFYFDIPGWFNFKCIYKNAVDEAQNGDHFVEIGAWLGQSTSFMAVEIANSGKKIKFDVVDIWDGVWDGIGEKDCYDLFLKNLSPVEKYINPIKMLSVEAAKLYRNQSLDFVFIDACHTYECVKADIAHWLPKVKRKKVIAGHDYDWLSVKKAVDEVFGNSVKEIKDTNIKGKDFEFSSSWCVTKIRKLI